VVITTASQPLGLRQVLVPLRSSHAAKTAARVRIVAALGVVAVSMMRAVRVRALV